MGKGWVFEILETLWRTYKLKAINVNNSTQYKASKKKEKNTLVNNLLFGTERQLHPLKLQNITVPSYVRFILVYCCRLQEFGSNVNVERNVPRSLRKLCFWNWILCFLISAECSLKYNCFCANWRVVVTVVMLKGLMDVILLVGVLAFLRLI